MDLYFVTVKYIILFIYRDSLPYCCFHRLLEKVDLSGARTSIMSLSVGLYFTLQKRQMICCWAEKGNLVKTSSTLASPLTLSLCCARGRGDPSAIRCRRGQGAGGSVLNVCRGDTDFSVCL